MTKGNDGKIKVEKAGLKEITREGFEYELTVNLELDHGHHATASKDRTGLFSGKPEFIPSEATGQMIAEWCENGVDPSIEINEAIAKLANCNSVDDLKMFKETVSVNVANSEAFKNAGKERMNQIINANKKPENATAN
jgi:hypothetical protein